MWVEVLFSIMSILSLLFCGIVIVDRTIFFQKMKDVEYGMTGKTIQHITGLKLEIFKIDGYVYYARVRSLLTLFKYRLVFSNGKLISKQRD